MGAKLDFVWHAGETRRLFKSQAMSDFVYSKTVELADEINAEAASYAKTPPKIPPYIASTRFLKNTVVGRIRPHTAQGRAIESQHSLFSHHGKA